jgi:DNA ligase-1
LDATFEQAVADGSEGLVCKSISQEAVYQAGARGWLWIKLKRDYRTELADTVDLVIIGAYAGRGRRRGTYGAVLLAAYDPEAEAYQTVGKCGTGFSDAELAELPAKLAPLIRTQRPARVDSRVSADCVVRAEPGARGAQRGADIVTEPHRRLGTA